MTTTETTRIHTTRIHYHAGGLHADRLDLPRYAVWGDGETRIEAVCRAIERRLRLVVCAGPRLDHRSQDRAGHVSARCYQMTLGRPCRGGGYTPAHELWISIPV